MRPTEGNHNDDESIGVDSDQDSTSTVESFADEEKAKPTIGAEENRRVIYSRILVGVVLVVCAAITASLAFMITDREEQKRFESEFAGVASEIIEVSQQAESNLVKIMDEFGTMVTSSALATGQTWPNVTIPDFERRANASQSVSGGRFLALSVAVPPTDDSRAAYNQYTAEHIGWLEESAKVANVTPTDILPFMISLNPAYEGEGDTVNPPGIPSFGDLLHLVTWQVSPPPTNNTLLIKVDWRHLFTPRFNYMRETGRTARSPTLYEGELTWVEEPTADPLNLYYQPIYDGFEENRTLVAFVQMALRWQDHFENVLHEDTEGIIVVVSDTCNQTFTVEINGQESVFLGKGDLHESYDYMGMTAGLTVALNDILDGSTESEAGISCGCSMTIYPSAKFHDKYRTSKPIAYTLVVLAIFGFTTFVFMLYDCLVQRRQDTVMDSAVKTNAIVDSLFPEGFRDQIMEQAKDDNGAKGEARESFQVNKVKSSLKMFMSGDAEVVEDDDLYLSKPLADLFPEATVVFADIVGFTSWSSVREPSQVFTLLESIYRTFDKIAKTRRIYKVETVGDAYLAVAGVPLPMPNHALVMARFARDCVMRLPLVVHRLEKFLGPGTRDIQMRFGLHSGPVTAGVLRGEKARFQLFGDTVNTAARIESSGQGNRIHLSESTAKLIVAAGKGGWVEARPDPVHLKGLGTMKTFWLSASARAGSVADRSQGNDSLCGSDWGEVKCTMNGSDRLNDQTQRLVEWNTENLLRLLRQIVASRGQPDARKQRRGSVTKLMPVIGEASSTLGEVAEIIALPTFCHQTAGNEKISPDTINLGPKVEKQLMSYVSWVAQSYKANPFHNFDHASHVCMSVSKLLSRIVAPELDI